MKLFVCLVLFGLAAGVSSTCSMEGIKKCVTEFLKDVVAQSSPNCGLVENYAKCLGPVISTCDPDAHAKIQDALNKFNCDIKLGGRATGVSLPEVSSGGVLSTCSTDVKKCVDQFIKNIAANSDAACALVEKYAACLRPVISTCDSNGKEKVQGGLDKYNKQYGCEGTIKGQATTAGATFLAVLLAAIFAAKFN